MEGNNPSQQSTEEMQLLLQQMRQTTILLAERLANQSPSASLGSPVLVPPATRPNLQSPPTSSVSSPSTSAFTNLTPVSQTGYRLRGGPSRHQRAPEHFSPYLNYASESSNDQVQTNLARLFRRNSVPPSGQRGRPHRGKKVPWNHCFVCLPEPDLDYVPNSEEARHYAACGIGKKMIYFGDNQGDHSYLTERLYENFPPLREAGGFVLARSDRSKCLKTIPIPPSGYSIQFLRLHAEVKRAPLYIIPLQQGLTLSPPVVETPSVMQKCLGCEEDLPLCEIQKHLETCSRLGEAIGDDTPACTELSSGTNEEPVEDTPECLEISDDDDDLAVAIYESLQSSHTAEVPCSEVSEVQSEEDEVTAVLKNIISQLVPGPPPSSNNIVVVRETVLDSAFRAFRRLRFSPVHHLSVTFVDCDGTGEGAVDDGGPTREFLRLLVVSIRDSRYFSGPEESKNLALVTRGVENGDYKLLGKMISVALVHGGIRPRFFSSRLYCSIACLPTPPISLHEVDDFDLREKLQKILDAETLRDTQEAVMEASGALSLLGCSDSLQTVDQKSLIVDEAARAYVEGRTKTAKEQFVDGLQTLEVSSAIKNHHETLKSLFVGGLQPVSLQDMQDLFCVKHAEPGSNRRRLENQTICFWNDWLMEVDEGTRPVTLGQILTFASGVDTIPPLGFYYRPVIEFLHGEHGNRRVFPEANTCEVILRLPVHLTYTLFVEYMESGILQSPTFGFI